MAGCETPYRERGITKHMSQEFLSREPELNDYWRGIVLFGANVASYKFALAKSLLELCPPAGSLVKLTDLAPVFSRHIREHLRIADKQITSSRSQFLDACRAFNTGRISETELLDKTIRFGFNNVIDAFHIVGRTELPKRFFTDERKQNKGIRINDEFSQLLGLKNSDNLPSEVESRWRLVETAWELGVSRSLLVIDHDPLAESLFTIDQQLRRKSITSSRGALNGYQKGRCFYCFATIDILDPANMPDVDHFFPHALKQAGFGSIIDGVWNLVLSCAHCNRGPNGKFANLPTIVLLERLYRRNEFLIASHHPLRETLMLQMGTRIEHRVAFLNKMHRSARSVLVHLWESKEQGNQAF